MLTHCRNIIAPFIMLCLLVACSSEPKMKEEWVAEQVEEEWFAEDVVAVQELIGTSFDSMKSVARVATSSPTNLTMLNPASANRKLIKNASLHIEVDNALATAQSITQTATAAGGYIADTSRQIIGDEQYMITMSVRIPSGTFDTITEGFQSLGTVLNFTANAQDVTEEYVDTESRARNLKLSEERLLEHLSRSAKLEDILKAEQEITRVRGQIEQLEGRLRFLSNRVDFSTVSIQLQDKPGAQQIVPKKSYSMQHVTSNAARSLFAFGQQLLTLGIWVLVWIPIWLPVVIVCLVVGKRMRAKNIGRYGSVHTPL
jgi:hypothetical protein